MPHSARSEASGAGGIAPSAVAAAIDDPTRTIDSSSMTDLLGAGTGAGALLSYAALLWPGYY
jgi:hypothetical protein